MNEKRGEEKQNDMTSCQAGQEKGKQNLALRSKPQWPTGLQLPADKDVTCFIPEELGIIL